MTSSHIGLSNPEQEIRALQTSAALRKLFPGVSDNMEPSEINYPRNLVSFIAPLHRAFNNFTFALQPAVSTKPDANLMLDVDASAYIYFVSYCCPLIERVAIKTLITDLSGEIIAMIIARLKTLQTLQTQYECYFGSSLLWSYAYWWWTIIFFMPSF